jgi:hypothetical protein
MTEVTVRLTDQNANANYPFLHQIGELVKSRVDGREGVVTNATFVGADHPGGAFEITYDIQTDNGDIVQIPLIELEKVKAISTTA